MTLVMSLRVDKELVILGNAIKGYYHSGKELKRRKNMLYIGDRILLQITTYPGSFTSI